MGSLEHAKIEMLNLSTGKWKNYSSYLSFKQIYSFAAFFNQDNFFVIGGKTKNKVLSLVAKFNPKTAELNRVGKLKFPRFNHRVEVIDDKL